MSRDYFWLTEDQFARLEPLYRDRNAIERMFGRLKDFRRIATRYDRSATNFLAAICLAPPLSATG